MENDISFAELRLIIADLARSQQETTELIRKDSAETNKKIKEIGKQIGGIGEKFGSFTEGLAYPSLRKMLYKNYGIDNTVANYLKQFPDGSEIEFDAFGFTNGSVNNAVVVEVKSHLQSKHIYKFKEELQKFRENFPDFSQKHLYGILATVRIVSKELQNEIYENGLHLAIIHDDIFDFKQNPNAIDWNA
jgi:hypothetical protein